MLMLITDSDDHSTLLNLLLVRFGIIAAVVAVLAVLVFAVAVRFKKRGREQDLRRYGETALRLWRAGRQNSGSAFRDRNRLR